MVCPALISPGVNPRSAVALEIVDAIFQRNPPKGEPEKEESVDEGADTKVKAAAGREAKKLEKDAKAKMEAHADHLLKDLLDE